MNKGTKSGNGMKEGTNMERLEKALHWGMFSTEGNAAVQNLVEDVFDQVVWEDGWDEEDILRAWKNRAVFELESLAEITEHWEATDSAVEDWVLGYLLHGQQPSWTNDYVERVLFSKPSWSA